MVRYYSKYLIKSRGLGEMVVNVPTKANEEILIIYGKIYSKV